MNNKQGFKNNSKEINKLYNNLDNCVDKHCRNNITSNQLREEELKFFKMVNEKCNSKLASKKYNECFIKYKNESEYSKKLTKIKECENKECSVYQNKIKKKENEKMKNINKLMNNLDKCGDKHCGKIITSNQMKEEGVKFLEKVTKKCKSKKVPETQEENKLQKEKYDKCFKKYKNKSEYPKKLAQRKECEDKECKNYQNKIKNKLFTKKI